MTVVNPAATVDRVAEKLQALAEHWGHPSWSDSWAQLVAQEALTTAEAALVADVNREAVICHDCGSLAMPRCEIQGHGFTTLGELIDTYS
jgi:hypothetical protein